MDISTAQIKELREKTGAGISDVKKALESGDGDMAKAVAFIERKLGSSAIKKASRETKIGIIEAYVHSNFRIGVLVELFCETDFVGRSPAFKELAHDIAMHIAAMSPSYLSINSVSAEVWQKEKDRIYSEVKKLGKPEHMLEEIAEGKLKSYFGEVSLLEQPFVKDQSKTVETIISEAVGKFGENIKVGRFIRLEI